MGKLVAYSTKAHRRSERRYGQQHTRTRDVRTRTQTQLDVLFLSPSPCLPTCLNSLLPCYACCLSKFISPLIGPWQRGSPNWRCASSCAYLRASTLTDIFCTRLPSQKPCYCWTVRPVTLEYTWIRRNIVKTKKRNTREKEYDKDPCTHQQQAIAMTLYNLWCCEKQ